LPFQKCYAIVAQLEGDTGLVRQMLSGADDFVENVKAASS